MNETEASLFPTEQPLAQRPWRLPELSELPKGRLDALIGLGMLVTPQLVGPEGERRVANGFIRQRLIPLAMKELGLDQAVKSDGLLVVSGQYSVSEKPFMDALGEYQSVDVSQKAQIIDQHFLIPKLLTKTPQFVQRLYINRLLNRVKKRKPKEYERLKEALAFFSFIPFHKHMGKPHTVEEAKKVQQTTQAELMAWMIQNAVGKPKPGRTERKNLTQIVIEEPLAENTVQNFIRAVNELDRYQSAKTGELWKGTLGVVTSNFGHVARGYELLVALGFDEQGNGYGLVPISAEQVLRHENYQGKFLDWHEEQNAPIGDLQNQERWRRGVREVPQYMIPELVHVEYDERLQFMLSGLERWYGPEALADYGLADYRNMPGAEIRDRIKRKGYEHLKLIVNASTREELDELGYVASQKDTEDEALDKLRSSIASSNEKQETVRKILLNKYAPEQLAQVWLPDLATVPTYVIRNWLYGRMLAPEAWKQLDPNREQFWRDEIRSTNDLTQDWLQTFNQ